eukprot:4462274-Pyramimonas_sp.AAC.1
MLSVTSAEKATAVAVAFSAAFVLGEWSRLRHLRGRRRRLGRRSRRRTSGGNRHSGPASSWLSAFTQPFWLNDTAGPRGVRGHPRVHTQGAAAHGGSAGQTAAEDE